MSSLYSYKVSCHRIHRPWFGDKYFYNPIKVNNVNQQISSIKDSMDMPTVWGYETVEEAWKIIDEVIHQEESS